MINRRVFTLLLVSFLAIGCAKQPNLFCGEAIAARDSQPREVAVLQDDVKPLRDAFNAQSTRWRAVSLVSPTCSECVFGAEVVAHELTTRYPMSQVAAITIWVPMLPSDNEQAARAAATIFAPNRSAHFYDAERNVGWEYARRTFQGFPERAKRSLPAGHWLTEAFENRAELIQPQWDLYMLYAPGVEWKAGEAPPMPTHWIRHFGRKEDRKTSTYWQDTPESGPREGDLYSAMRMMAEQAIGRSPARK